MESATVGPKYSRLLWKGRNGWNGGEDAGVESDNEKPHITVIGRDVRIYEPTQDQSLFRKIGQFDTEVKEWDVDAWGVIWAYLTNGKVVRLETVMGSANVSGNSEKEATIQIIT